MITTRRALAVLTLGAALLLVPFVPASAAPASPGAPMPVTVALKPNGSAISGTATITGRTVTATAKGLNPAKRYISLYYGSQSTATPGQTFTCADARTAADPRGWGLTPEWTVNPDGTGTLNATAARDLTGVYTMSIREVSALAGPDPYLGFTPVTYPVRACGSVQPDAGGLVKAPNVLPDVTGSVSGVATIAQNPTAVGTGGLPAVVGSGSYGSPTPTSTSPTSTPALPSLPALPVP